VNSTPTAQLQSGQAAVIDAPETEPVVTPVPAAELADTAPALVDLFVANVNAGASLGYVAPLARGDALRYWLSLRGDLHSGARLLLVARVDGRIVGSGQLLMPQWPAALHRAELQKLFVTPDLKGRGIGRRLVAELHAAARRQQRSLLILNTRSGEPPVAFYKKLGYREAGVIPGYIRTGTDVRHASMMLYQELPA